MIFKKSLISTLKSISDDPAFEKTLELEFHIENPFTIKEWLSVITAKKTTKHRVNSILNYISKRHFEHLETILSHFQYQCGHVETCFNIKTTHRFLPFDTNYFTNQNIINAIKSFNNPEQAVVNLLNKLDEISNTKSDKIRSNLKKINHEISLIVDAATDKKWNINYVPSNHLYIDPNPNTPTTIYKWIKNPQFIEITINFICSHSNAPIQTKLESITEILNYTHHTLSKPTALNVRSLITQSFFLLDKPAIKTGLTTYLQFHEQMNYIDITPALFHNKHSNNILYPTFYNISIFTTFLKLYNQTNINPDISKILANYITNSETQSLLNCCDNYTICEFLAKNEPYPKIKFTKDTINIYGYNHPNNQEYRNTVNIILNKYENNDSLKEFLETNNLNNLHNSCKFNKHLHIDANITSTSSPKEIASTLKHIMQYGSDEDQKYLIEKISELATETP
ncbi:hypothetical protein [Bacteroides sp.]|uniref:hypothetical protein n=1 Tax=Bacteroides sp. TaxID=29523 RepID=UPI00261CA0AE|nr:hypothetical protein [Bacteroides sp.]MDD3039062.1 hypothetical protein [Bacteroides sp.]